MLSTSKIQMVCKSKAPYIAIKLRLDKGKILGKFLVAKWKLFFAIKLRCRAIHYRASRYRKFRSESNKCLTLFYGVVFGCRCANGSKLTCSVHEERLKVETNSLTAHNTRKALCLAPETFWLVGSTWEFSSLVVLVIKLSTLKMLLVVNIVAVIYGRLWHIKTLWKCFLCIVGLLEKLKSEELEQKLVMTFPDEWDCWAIPVRVL